MTVFYAAILAALPATAWAVRRIKPDATFGHIMPVWVFVCFCWVFALATFAERDRAESNPHDTEHKTEPR